MQKELFTTAWKEIDAGIIARKQGLEGRSRVNVRRAVAGALSIYYQAKTGAIPTPRGYSLIEYASKDSDFPQNIRESLARLCIRVNEDFALDPSIDLLNIAYMLVTYFQEECCP